MGSLLSKACLNCAAPLPQGGLSCEFCGSSHVVTGDGYQSACPGCGSGNPPHAKHCVQCRAVAPPNPYPAPVRQRATESVGWSFGVVRPLRGTPGDDHVVTHRIAGAEAHVRAHARQHDRTGREPLPHTDRTHP